jgi:hypothetical protein
MKQERWDQLAAVAETLCRQLDKEIPRALEETWRRLAAPEATLESRASALLTTVALLDARRTLDPAPGPPAQAF